MIFYGNQRGNARDLADHLMNDRDNDHVHVHEVRGFVADDLHGAFAESYWISKGTKCRQHLYSLSINPPPDELVETVAFKEAIDRAEKSLGLLGQPRAIVFHEKNGRRHAHAVWSRIDGEEMKAINLPYTKYKLQDLSRELYIQHGWDMPPGLLDKNARDPLNFSLAEWQQAKRIGVDPRAMKKRFQDAWSLSDNKAAFTHALRERGLHLAKGDRRSFVAVDAVTDEVFAIPKWVGVKTKAVRERLGEEQELPSITETRAKIAKGLLPKIDQFKDELSAKEDRQQSRLNTERQKLAEKQRDERQDLHTQHTERQQAETLKREASFRKGLFGLWDRLTGKRKEQEKTNVAQAQAAECRDRDERQGLSQNHHAQREKLNTIRTRAAERIEEQRKSVEAEQERLTAMKEASPPEPDKQDSRAARKAAYLAKRQPSGATLQQAKDTARSAMSKAASGDNAETAKEKAKAEFLAKRRAAQRNQSPGHER